MAESLFAKESKAACSASAKAMVTPKKQGGAKRSLTHDQTVQKRIRENPNLKAVSENIMDGVLDENGNSLRMELSIDIKKNEEKKGSVIMGKHYYANKVAKFTQLAQAKSQEIGVSVGSGGNGGSGPASTQVTVRPALMKAMVSWQSTPANREPMFSFVASGPKEINAKEVVGLINCFKSLKPSQGNPALLHGAMRLLTFFGAERFQDKFSERVAGASDQIDDDLQLSWDLFRKVTDDKEAFLNENRDAIKLLIADQDLTKIESEKGSYANCIESLKRATKYRIGKSLFSSALGVVQAERLTRFVDNAVAQFLHADAEVTKASVKEFVSATTAEALALDGVDSLPPKREMEVSYRGYRWNQITKAPGTDVQAKLYHALKSILVQRGLIPPIFCESDLVVDVVDAQATRLRFAADFVEPLKKVRQRMNNVLNALEMKDATSVKVEIKKQEASMMQADPTWKLCESEFWDSVGASGASGIFTEKFFALLASDKTVSSVDASILRVRELNKSQLFDFIPVPLQNNAKTALASLVALQIGDDPGIESSSASAFLVRFKAQLVWFCEAYKGKRGKMALDLMLQDAIANTDPKKIEKSVFGKMFAYGFAYSPDNFAKLIEIAKKAQYTPEQKSVGSASGASSKASQKKEGETQVLESAMNMFED